MKYLWQCRSCWADGVVEYSADILAAVDIQHAEADRACFVRNGRDTIVALPAEYARWTERVAPFTEHVYRFLEG